MAMNPATQPATLSPVRCPQCRKVLAEQLRDGALYATCPRCKTAFVADARTQTVTRRPAA